MKLAQLIGGALRFSKTASTGGKDYAFKHLAKEQQPHTLLIGCSDSRVPPVVLFGAEPGEIFPHVNIAGIVPPYPLVRKTQETKEWENCLSTNIPWQVRWESATALASTMSPAQSTWAVLEFAVKHLKVEHVGVMGHTHCGGIRALLEGGESEFLHPWVNQATPAKEKVLATMRDKSKDEILRALERESVLLSVENLRASPWIKDREKNNALQLLAIMHDIETGEKSFYDPQQTTWLNLEDFARNIEKKSWGYRVSEASHHDCCPVRKL